MMKTKNPTHFGSRSDRARPGFQKTGYDEAALAAAEAKRERRRANARERRG